MSKTTTTTVITTTTTTTTITTITITSITITKTITTTTIVLYKKQKKIVFRLISKCKPYCELRLYFFVFSKYN
jgi:hypothetical protein